MQAYEESIGIKSTAYLEGYDEGMRTGFNAALEHIEDKVQSAARRIAEEILKRELTVTPQTVIQLCLPVITRIKHMHPISIIVHPSCKEAIEQLLIEQKLLATIFTSDQCTIGDVLFKLPTGEIEIHTEEYLRSFLEHTCPTHPQT